MPTLLVLLHSPILCPTRLSSANLEKEFLGFCGSGSNYPWELSYFTIHFLLRAPERAPPLQPGVEMWLCPFQRLRHAGQCLALNSSLETRSL